MSCVSKRAGAVSLLGALLLQPVLAAGALAVSSHTALYELALKSVESGGDIQSLSGRMAVAIQDTCNGYTFEQGLLTQVRFGEGEAVTRDFRISAFEAKDGTLYRFDNTSRINGEQSDRVTGRAERDASGGGMISFTAPEELSRPFAADALMPMQHIDALVAAAKAGARRIVIDVIDPGADGWLFEAAAFISGGGNGLEPPVQGSSLVAGMPYWNVRLAYFPKTPGVEPSGPAGEALPDYEVGFRLYANGISTHLVMDYGDFVVNGTLVELRPGEDFNCPK